MKSKLFLLIFLSVFCKASFTQSQTKKLHAKKTTASVNINGLLNEDVWQNAPVASEFVQFEPQNGIPSHFTSRVKIIYNNQAIYIGAELLDPSPDSIRRQLGKRDEIGQTDFFGVVFDPFNDGLTGYTFIVTAANVQFDARQSSFEDSSWDAVWKSAVTETKKGWIAEMEIPYSALRFPATEIQNWGFNAVRYVQRTREKSFWNSVDPKIDGFLKQAGLLTNIKDIKPPIRLSFTPYVSGYVLQNSERSDIDFSFKGGLDLKYGINESYTLDMMLIPDFGQVESDDEVLNISPFETYYEEKRPFFTEGTELFAKGDIFYSRRIGAVPQKFWEVEDDLNDDEIIRKNPQTAQLINVTKISGKGKNGLGIGFLNGMSKKTYAQIKDTASGLIRKYLTQPFTNYNVFVVDQALKNNSFISLTNTNFYQPTISYLAHVAATDFRFETAGGNYAIEGQAGFSYINNDEQADSTGYKYNLSYEKITGNFRFELSQSLANKKYNPNDMGYIYKTDELESELELNYNIYQPFWKMIRWHNSIELSQYTYFSKKENIGTELSFRTFTTLKNYLSLNLRGDFTLGNINDFYEPRVDNRVYKRPGYWNLSYFISPDYRKKFVIDQFAGYRATYNRAEKGAWIGITPIYRVDDHFNFNLTVNYDKAFSNIGFADTNEAEDSIYFGKRVINTLINELNANYVFNSKSALSFKLRHYWRTIDYTSFYLLAKNGTLKDDADFTIDNINTNYFNIDLAYTWRFAPGSELSVVWKNSISNEADHIVANYMENLQNFKTFEQNNSLSFRLIYYIDYLTLKQRI